MSVRPEFDTTHVVDIEEQRVLRVLETLRRWDQRNNGHQSEKRAAPRSSFESSILVTTMAPPAGGKGAPELVSFWAWSRNLSTRGMAIIVGREAIPRAIDDKARVIRMEEVLKIGKKLRIGIPKGTEFIWFFAEVKRFRTTHEGFIDVGVELTKRATDPRGSAQEAAAG